MKKILTADFSKGNEKAYVRGLYQHDYGAILKVTGIEYAEIIRVDFAGPNDEKAHPVVALQESDGGFCVKIPKENTDKAGELSAYIYVTDAEAGFTIKEVILPIIGRVEADPDPSGEKTDPFAEAIEEIKKNAKSASDSAASAAESEKSASKSATQAEKSAVQSWKAVEAAAISEKAAATSATAAAESASQSRESAAIASSAADQAAKSATAAAESATTAAQLAENATRSATNASGSAESASQSAETAKTAADAASKSGSAAQQAAGSASESASTATAAAQTATTAAGKAAGSATSASQSAENAGQKATAAETAAGSAAESETEAAKSATAAGDSASAAKTSETAAEEAAQTAQEQAEKIKASAEQIEKNKTDVTSLKEDLSNKITKFYASNQGEIHITDSDNGKIQDMMIYGKSSQDGTPTIENPVEIKSVVNPTVKVCGKNLFDSKKFPIILKRAINVETGDIYESATGKYCATEKYMPFPYGGKIISYNASMSLYAYDKDYKFISIFKRNGQAPFGTRYVRLDIRIEEKDKAQIELSENATTYEPYKEQTIQLPITLNAIPVTQGGNVTINGQQYIADYVDVERGKVVRMCGRETLNTKNGQINEEYRLALDIASVGYNDGSKECIFSTFEWSSWGTCVAGNLLYIKNIKKPNNEFYTAQKLKELSLDFDAIYQLAEKQEIDLTTEQITAFKELVTYYPVTNVSVNSEQLDGYTVFNYPISMANGWNYVKKQLNDNRDYIYDMDTQSAEAYVNSEYAVALTELEV